MKKLIDQRGVQDEFGIPADTMDKLRARGVAPPWLKIGHKIYFVRDELHKWLDEQQAKATGKSPEEQPRTHALDAALKAILDTVGLSDGVRTQIAELIGASGQEAQPARVDSTLLGTLAVDDESRERLIGGAANETR